MDLPLTRAGRPFAAIVFEMHEAVLMLMCDRRQAHGMADAVDVKLNHVPPFFGKKSAPILQY